MSKNQVSEPEIMESNVLSSTSIGAKVEFNLTKDDLIELIIEERREALTKQLESAKTTSSSLRETCLTLEEKLYEHFFLTTKKEKAKEIKQAESLFGSKVTLKKRDKHQVKGITVVPPCMFNCLDIDYKNKKIEVQRKLGGWWILDELTVSNTVGEQYKNTSNNIGFWGYKIDLDEENLKGLTIWKELITATHKYTESVVNEAHLSNELVDLDFSTRRAKAKMVRDLLSASDQGKELLGKLNSGVKLLESKK